MSGLGVKREFNTIMTEERENRGRERTEGETRRERDEMEDETEMEIQKHTSTFIISSTEHYTDDNNIII